MCIRRVEGVVLGDKVPPTGGVTGGSVNMEVEILTKVQRSEEKEEDGYLYCG